MKHQTLLINQTIRKEKLKTKTKRNNLSLIKIHIRNSKYIFQLPLNKLKYTVIK